MKPETKAKRFLEHLLRDRTYLDYWSLIHFGFGILIGFLLKLIGFSLITAIFATLAFIAFWEIIEPRIFKQILKKEFRENIKNQLMDIVYGFLGFLVYWYFL